MTGMSDDYVTWGGFGYTKTECWPTLGTRVRLTRYSAGNLYTGDASAPDFQVTGRVTETPDSGSVYLTVHSEEEIPVPPGQGFYFDRQDPESWSVTPEKVTLRKGEFWRWDIKYLAPPNERGLTEHERLTARVEQVFTDHDDELITADGQRVMLTRAEIRLLLKGTS